MPVRNEPLIYRAIRSLFKKFVCGLWYISSMQVFYVLGLGFLKAQSDFGHPGAVDGLWCSEVMITQQVLTVFLCPPFQFGSHAMSDERGHW